MSWLHSYTGSVVPTLLSGGRASFTMYVFMCVLITPMLHQERLRQMCQILSANLHPAQSSRVSEAPQKR